jgi:hypothetical protein
MQAESVTRFVVGSWQGKRRGDMYLNAGRSRVKASVRTKRLARATRRVIKSLISKNEGNRGSDAFVHLRVRK